MRDVTVTTLPPGKFTQTVTAGPNTFTADEPVDAGGTDLGPSPFDLVYAGLGTCTSMTMKLYAERKGIPLAGCVVTVRGQSKDGVFRLEREITMKGDLTDDQKKRLLEIADKCPVHRALTSKIEISTKG